MQPNLTAYLVFSGCSAAACILWFYWADRRGKKGRSLPLALCSAILGVLLGTVCARLAWVLFRLNTHPVLFAVHYNELSYYGGLAGVILAVSLSAKICRRPVREVLNTFAPMGACLAGLMRCAEYFLGMTGLGAWLENGLFFPLAVEIVWDPDYSEFYLAVFTFEAFFSFAAAVFSLLRRGERDRFLRTLFYLCLPQIFCESLRAVSISWLFVRVEQLLCFLFCEGVLVFYAVRRGPGSFRSWLPALSGLAVSGLVIAAEFALDGKITVGPDPLPHWLIYAVVLLALAFLAFMEHTGCRQKKPAP